MLPWLKILPADAVVASFRTESNSGAADASDGVRVLRLSRNAINGRFCGAFARDATGVLYFLSFISERPQRVLVRCLSLHVLTSDLRRNVGGNFICRQFSSAFR